MVRMLTIAFGIVILPVASYAAYVQMDTQGHVVGVFANLQPSIAGVQNIPDEDPRITAFRNAQAKLMSQAPVDRMKRLTDLLVTKGVITPAQQTKLLGP